MFKNTLPVMGFPPSLVGGVQAILAKFGPNSLTFGCPGASGVSKKNRKI